MAARRIVEAIVHRGRRLRLSAQPLSCLLRRAAEAKILASTVSGREEHPS